MILVRKWRSRNFARQDEKRREYPLIFPSIFVKYCEIDASEVREEDYEMSAQCGYNYNFEELFLLIACIIQLKRTKKFSEVKLERAQGECLGIRSRRRT